jgi:hypothetical protein
MRYGTERTLAARVKALGESTEGGACAELAAFFYLAFTAGAAARGVGAGEAGGGGGCGVCGGYAAAAAGRCPPLDGTLVQSDGERRIAEWLAANRIAYRYDARLRIIEGFQIRPDFYLPEYDVYIEYWGMGTPRYKAGMYLKQDLYMHAGKRLISLYPDDKLRLNTILRDKLASFIRLSPTLSPPALTSTISIRWFVRPACLPQPFSRALTKLSMSAASCGPTSTFQPGSASSSSPLICAT